MPPEEVIDDRKATIEAAFSQLEEKGDDVTPEPVAKVEGAAEAPPKGEDTGGTAAEPVVAAVEAAPVAEKADEKPAEQQEQQFPVDKAPQSWRAAQKQKWDTLPPDVRQEVMRREREITKTLGESAQARQFATTFAKTLQPYEARIRGSGVDPMTAVHNLVQSDYFLSTAPVKQRAMFMAKLIKDYGIDVNELDSALAGTATPDDPVTSKVDRLLQERLAPMQQFMQNQQQERAAAQQRESEKVVTTIDQMAQDPKFPHFENVREDMADLIELQAKKGLYLSLDQAYTRAIAMNPEVSKLVADQSRAEVDAATARTAHARAQKALKASQSVGGAPSGKAGGASGALGRREAIEAAFEQASGR